jgi:hypothetical protein
LKALERTISWDGVIVLEGCRWPRMVNVGRGTAGSFGIVKLTRSLGEGVRAAVVLARYVWRLLVVSLKIT